MPVQLRYIVVLVCEYRMCLISVCWTRREYGHSTRSDLLEVRVKPRCVLVQVKDIKTETAMGQKVLR